MSLFLDTILGKKKNLFLISLLFILLFFGYQSLNLKLDASSDTLILENDKDLIATREVSDTYSSNEFLIITLSNADGIVTTKNIEFIKEINQLYEYELPNNLIGIIWKGKFRGQKQKWFIAKFLGDDGEVNLNTEHQEFIEWKWINIEMLPIVVVAVSYTHLTLPTTPYV